MERDAATSRLNPTAEEIQAAESAADTDTDAGSADTDSHAGSASVAGRLGGGWVAAIAAVLIIVAAALTGVGYLLLQWNARSDQIARDDAVALQAAKDCVIATQAPDLASMGA